MLAIRAPHFLFLCLLFLWTGTPAAEDGPEATVDRLHDGLLSLDARLPPEDFAQRRKAARELLNATHDLGYMARFSLGRHWRQLSDAQRTRFLNAFEELSISSYADNFSDIQQTRFRLIETHSLPRNRVQVRTQILPADDTPVALDYTLQSTPDKGWRIIHVRAEGVSDLALKRSQYSALLEQKDFDALLDYVYAQAAVSGS